MSQSAGVGRGILNVTIKDKNTLCSAYMPFLKTGGLFLSTNKLHQLGDEIFMLINLLDDPEKMAVSGKVVWITPAGAGRGKPQGVGVSFIGESAESVRSRIETHLAGMLQLDKDTHTL